MNPFRIFPIEDDIAGLIRETRTDGHGNHDIQPAVTSESGAVPCRVCLEEASVGEEVLLFSYSPFGRPAPYRTVGPIFVHMRACASYDRHAAIPGMMRRRLLALRGYDANDRMLECDVTQGAELETLIERFFANSAVAYLHAHNAKAGCFVCRIERGV